MASAADAATTMASAAAAATTTEVFVVRSVSTDEEVSTDCFGFRETAVPPLAEGSLLLRTCFITLEPYMRVFGISGNWPVGSVPGGKLVGKVLQSTSPRFAVGDFVKCSAPWRTITWVAAEATLVEPLDASVPLQLYLGLAGSGGRSAFLPLKHVARPLAGQTAVVTAASSAVGLAAVQKMAMDGVRVVGTCGTDEKVQLLETLGCAAFNYRTEAAADALKRLCPDGVDFLFDNVHGAMRLAVLEAMNAGAQILTSGKIANYDAVGGPAGIDDEREAALKREKSIVNHGQFYVGNWEDEFLACTAEIVELFKQGKLVSKDTVVDGLENLPRAFVGIFRGENVGRMVIKVTE